MAKGWHWCKTFNSLPRSLQEDKHTSTQAVIILLEIYKKRDRISQRSSRPWVDLERGLKPLIAGIIEIGIQINIHTGGTSQYPYLVLIEIGQCHLNKIWSSLAKELKVERKISSLQNILYVKDINPFSVGKNDKLSLD